MFILIKLIIYNKYKYTNTLTLKMSEEFLTEYFSLGKINDNSDNSDNSDNFVAFLQRHQNNNRSIKILVNQKPLEQTYTQFSAYDTVKIFSKDSVIIYLTNQNWGKYDYYLYYTNIILIGPVETISHQWLSSALNTKLIRFCLPRLATIGTRMLDDGCLDYCKCIQHLDFRDLPSLTSIGSNMFKQSEELEESVVLESSMPTLKSIVFNYNHELANNLHWLARGFTPVHFSGTGRLDKSDGKWWFTTNDKRIPIDNLFFGDNWHDWIESYSDYKIVLIPRPDQKVVTITSYMFYGALYEHSFNIQDPTRRF